MPLEVNSLEWHDIITHNPPPGEKFVSYTILAIKPNMYARLEDGKEFIIVDTIETGERRRPLEELLQSQSNKEDIEQLTQEARERREQSRE